jgi:hypothetical protein
MCPHRAASLFLLISSRRHWDDAYFPSIPFNTLEGRVAPQNSFVSIQLADSNGSGRFIKFITGDNLQKMLRGIKGH